MQIHTITKDNFDTEVINSQVPVLLDFWASWCGPCRMMSPVIDEIAAENPDIKVGKVNVDEEESLAQRYGIMSIPTLLIMKNGQVVSQTAGARLKSEVQDLLAGLL